MGELCEDKELYLQQHVIYQEFYTLEIVLNPQSKRKIYSNVKRRGIIFATTCNIQELYLGNSSSK